MELWGGGGVHKREGSTGERVHRREGSTGGRGPQEGGVHTRHKKWMRDIQCNNYNVEWHNHHTDNRAVLLSK